jgi:hypothetical protein
LFRGAKLKTMAKFSPALVRRLSLVVFILSVSLHIGCGSWSKQAIFENLFA